MIRLALDAMGGDGGVDPVVAGAARFSLETPDTTVILCGDPVVVLSRLQLTRTVFEAPRTELKPMVPAT